MRTAIALIISLLAAALIVCAIVSRRSDRDIAPKVTHFLLSLLGPMVRNLLIIVAHTVPVALVCGAILGLAFSLTTVVPALVTKDVFGQANYRRVFPVVMLVGTLANASFASLIGYIYDGAGSYRPAMLLLTAFLAGIVVLLFLLYRTRATDRNVKNIS